MPEAPQTDEGWYALHDFRTIDWDAWRSAEERKRERAIESGVEFLQTHEALEDADDGGTAVFSVLGHKADILILHLRPETTHLDTAERRFEQTAFAEFTEQVSSYVSVTEVSGYMSQEYFESGEVADSGMARYIRSRIEPDIPESEHVCFYPMDKRREEDNWYDLPFDERADLMSNHGEIGRKYAGKVTQIITGSIGFDDYEWGVTLFADDPTDIKHLLYEMRFDPSSSRYADFGPFYFGRRFPPTDLGAILAGEPVPASTDDETSENELSEELDQLGVSVEAIEDTAFGVIVPCEASAETVNEAVDGLRGNFEHYDSHIETAVHGENSPTVLSLWTTNRAADTAAGFLEDLPGASEATVGSLTGKTNAEDASETTDREHETDQSDVEDEVREELESLDIYAGKPHGEDVYAMVLYSTAPVSEVDAAVSDLRDGFDRYDTHVETGVYRARERDRVAVVSIWETQRAADTAGGYLADLPGIVARAGDTSENGDEPMQESGFGTMGMFYSVKPEHREDFVGKFETVGDVLTDLDGHLETDLMVNVDDENDMFIASQWRSKEDAMDFFRSDAFRDTVKWGRDILTDRPRHVFLA